MDIGAWVKIVPGENWRTGAVINRVGQVQSQEAGEEGEDRIWVDFGNSRIPRRWFVARELQPVAEPPHKVGDQVAGSYIQFISHDDGGYLYHTTAGPHGVRDQMGTPKSAHKKLVAYR